MLELVDVSKKWGEFGHRGVSLEVKKGEFFVLLGPSGSGKSLLLELICGFDRVDSGRIVINGRDVTMLLPEKRRVGMVYQDQMLFPHMNVRENVSYGPRVSGRDVEVTRGKVDELAETLQIGELLDRRVDRLSIGQKQRVALARGLAAEPDILLMDEPFSSLDVPLRKALWGELRGLHRATGMTMLLVTHDRTEAIALGERIGVIRDGRIEQVGEEADVFERPGSSFVAEFTGGKNILKGFSGDAGDGLRAFSCDGQVLRSTSEVTGECHAVVRPENIIISPEVFRTSARNTLDGVVASVERAGPLYEVTGRFGAMSLTTIVTGQSVEELGLAQGRRVFFYFKAGSVHLFREETKEAMGAGPVT